MQGLKWLPNFCVMLIFFIAMPTSAVWAQQKSTVETQEFRTYKDITDKLPLKEAVNMLIKYAQSGDCGAAHHLSLFLHDNSLSDPDGHDEHYWLLFAAKCGHIPSMIEIGFPSSYTTKGSLACGGNKLEIETHCNPLKTEIGYPVCSSQKFSFFDKLGKLMKKYVVSYKADSIDRTIAVSVSCSQQQEDAFYIITTTNFGSCAGSGAPFCEWDDVFDTSGKYIGYIGAEPVHSLFDIIPKTLPESVEKNIVAEKEPYPSKIDLYPKLYPKY